MTISWWWLVLTAWAAAAIGYVGRGLLAGIHSAPQASPMHNSNDDDLRDACLRLAREARSRGFSQAADIIETATIALPLPH